VVAALALIGAAGAVGGWAGPRRRLRSVTPQPSTRRRWRRSVPSPRVCLVAATLVAGVLGAVLGGPVAALAGAVYGGAAMRVWLRRRLALAYAAAHRGCLDAAAGLADDIRAGRSPEEALAGATATIHPLVDRATQGALRVVTGAARTGADVPEALRAVRHAALVPVFRRLAAIWTLNDAGVPLVELLDRLESELRAHRRGAERAAAQMAAARTTARLLAVLPLFGLVLGHLLGADPLDAVLRTTVGGVSATLGMALQVAGSAWTERIARPAAVTG
jgi:tight adherence protein B